MEIIIAETFYSQGHITLNNKYVELFSKLGNITIVDNGRHFEHNPKNKYITIKPFTVKRFELFKIIVYVINYIRLAFAIRNCKYDRLFLMSVHNSALYFALPFFDTKKIVVFHHYDIDRTMGLRWERWIVKLYMNKIKHVVLANFIKEGLVNELKISANNVYVVHQPIIKKNHDNSAKSNYFIGIGRNNDNSFLKKLIELDKETNKNKRYKILMRSVEIEYKGNNLEIFNKYLPRIEYDRLLSEASASIVIYPNSYKYRYSGIIDDSLSYSTPIIANNIQVSQYFHSIYPNSCHIIYTPENLWDLADSMIDDIPIEEKELFYERHKDEYVINQLQLLLSKK